MYNLLKMEQDFNERAREKTKKVYEEGNRLSKLGHTCVGYLESYPPQLSWCGQEVCESKTDQ